VARITAIEWDRREARLVVARATGPRAELEAVVSVPLEGEGGALDPAELGAALRRAVAEHRASRATVLVGVDRASVDLLSLQLPPATDAELPELVANEAVRASQVMGDEAVVDFLPLDDRTGEGRRVIAAVLSAERLEQIRQTCRAAGLTPHRLLLRSFAPASLFCRAHASAQETCLLVSPASEEMDMAILVGGRPVYWRTARLPQAAGPAEHVERLLAEIRRTMAVSSQDVEAGVDRVYVFGRDGQHEDLLRRLQEELSLPAVSFDPFSTVKIPPRIVPENPGRFAAVLGMVLDEAHGAGHAMDFLHPRRPRRQTTRGTLMIAAALVVVLVVAALGGMVWRRLADMDAANAELAADLEELNELTEKAPQQRQMVELIREWQAGDVAWLEELRELSERFPAAEDAIVLRMSMSSAKDGGQIGFQGLVRDPAHIVRLEYALRDAYHRVRSRRIQEGARQDPQYTCLFDAVVNVTKRSRNQYLAEQGRKP